MAEKSDKEGKERQDMETLKSSDSQHPSFKQILIQDPSHNLSHNLSPFPTPLLQPVNDQKANTKISPLFEGYILASSGMSEDYEIPDLFNSDIGGTPFYHMYLIESLWRFWWVSTKEAHWWFWKLDVRIRYSAMQKAMATMTATATGTTTRATMTLLVLVMVISDTVSFPKFVDNIVSGQAMKSLTQDAIWREALPKPANKLICEEIPPVHWRGWHRYGKGPGPSDRPKVTKIGLKSSHWDVSLPRSVHDTSPPCGAILLSPEFHVAPSNPHSVVEPQLPFPKDHVTYWKSCFNSLTIPTQKYLAHVVDWAQTTGCSDDHKSIANCLDFLDERGPS